MASNQSLYIFSASQPDLSYLLSLPISSLPTHFSLNPWLQDGLQDVFVLLRAHTCAVRKEWANNFFLLDLTKLNVIVLDGCFVANVYLILSWTILDFKELAHFSGSCWISKQLQKLFCQRARSRAFPSATCQASSRPSKAAFLWKLGWWVAFGFIHETHIKLKSGAPRPPAKWLTATFFIFTCHSFVFYL